MKLLASFTAIIAAAAAGQVYTSQPAESYAKSAEIYQSALEYQQQGLYSDQSQYTGGVDQSHAYSGEHASQRPAGEREARILSLVSESDDHGYHYAYETDNGIKAQESGQTAHDKGTEAHGGFSYTGDDGQVYTLTYTADEHGFHPQGAHLPTPPPIPEAIAKSLEQNAKEEAAGIFDDGKYVEEHQANYQEVQQLHPTQQQFHPTQQQFHPTQQQFHPTQHSHQQASHTLQYETTAFQQDGHDGYHTLNVPGYHKH